MIPNEGDKHKSNTKNNRAHFSQKLLEHTPTTLATGLILILGGYTYHIYYEHSVQEKIPNAFYSKISTSSHDSDTPHNRDEFNIQRPEQPLIDDIVRGIETGHYWFIFDEKSTGKTSMLVHAMRDIYVSSLPRTAREGFLYL